jgi:hypothetical protein
MGDFPEDDQQRPDRLTLILYSNIHVYSIVRNLIPKISKNVNRQAIRLMIYLLTQMPGSGE